MSEAKPIYVSWCAKDALDGTLQLKPMTELAYRRILDMIYATGDALCDDDAVMQYATKTGAKWKSIKRELIEVHKKIYIEDGYIRNEVCTAKLEKSRENIAQKVWAGNSSAEARKALKNNNRGSTGVGTDVPTGVPTKQKAESRKETTDVVSSAAPEKITFDFGTGKFSGVTEAQRGAWREAFPAVDLEGEAARAAAWLIANPKNKKSNYARFLNNWFARTQDNGGTRHGQRPDGNRNKPTPVEGIFAGFAHAKMPDDVSGF